MQSHLSENRAEMELVGRLHPDCRQYWETYAKFGLWKPGTLMAHCVHSDRRERDAMREAGVTAVHCAASNNALCSGIAPVRVMLNEGVKVALGSDVAGGDRLSLFDGVAMTLRASKDRRILDHWETEALTVPEAWYLGTSAGRVLRGRPGLRAGEPPPRHGAGRQRPARRPGSSASASALSAASTTARRTPSGRCGARGRRSTRHNLET